MGSSSAAGQTGTVNGAQIGASQSGVANSNVAQQQLLAALQGQNGLGAQNQVYNQLQGIAQGTGPNPALAQLNQTTQQNIANQGALMASQRGASANPELIARQAAQQGGALQQQAAGQAATMAAQQQLGGIQAAAGQANTMAGQQIGQSNQIAQNMLANQGQTFGANAAQNQTDASVYGSQLGVAGSVAGGASQGVGAGLTKGALAAAPAAAAQGGMIEKMAAGGQIIPQGPQSKYIQSLYGQSPTMFSGGMTHDYRSGGKVNATKPSEKAVKSGNSYSNDKIPAILSEHEIVIPRNITMGADPIRAASEFVAKTLAQRKAHGGDIKKKPIKMNSGGDPVDYVTAPPDAAQEAVNTAGSSFPDYDKSQTGFEAIGNDISDMAGGPRPVVNRQGKITQPTDNTSVPDQTTDQAPDQTPDQNQAASTETQQEQPNQTTTAPADENQSSSSNLDKELMNDKYMNTQSADVNAAPAPPTTFDKNAVSADRKQIMNDVLAGHVQAKTYSDLWKDKSLPDRLLGYLGLFFGGLGSGLTHMPNQALGMMDNEIERDFKSQELNQSQDYKNSLVKQVQQRQEADILRLAHENNYTDAQTKAALNINSWNNQINQKALSNAAVLHEMTKKVQNMNLSPEARQNMMNGLALIAPHLDMKFNNLEDVAAANSSMMNLGLQNEGQGQGNSEQNFQSMIQGLSANGRADMANYYVSRHIPGVPGLASRPVPEGIRDQIQAMNVLDDKGKDVLNFVKQHSGSWNPQTQARAEQKVEELKNFYNNSIEGGQLTQGRLHWYDEQLKKDPLSIVNQLLGSTERMKEVVNSNANRRDLLLYGPGGLGFSKSKAQSNNGQQMQQGQQSIQPKEGQTGIQTSTGKPIIFRNGSWVLQLGVR